MALEDNIKYFRKEKGLSQKELGEIIGVAQKQISQYASGQRRPDCFNIVYLARALDVTCEELVNGVQMKLYRLWQNDNNDYDTYDSAVVCAESEDEAKSIADTEFSGDLAYGSWVSIDKVKCQLIGNAVSGMKKGIIVASFNAG